MQEVESLNAVLDIHLHTTGLGPWVVDKTLVDKIRNVVNDSATTADDIHSLIDNSGFNGTDGASEVAIRLTNLLLLKETAELKERISSVLRLKVVDDLALRKAHDLADRLQAAEYEEDRGLLLQLAGMLREHYVILKKDDSHGPDSEPDTNPLPREEILSKDVLVSQAEMDAVIARREELRQAFRGREIPKDFECPIDLDLMVDPVRTVTGHVFERVALLKYWQTKPEQRGWDPINNQEMAHLTLKRDTVMKDAIMNAMKDAIKSGNVFRQQVEELTAFYALCSLSLHLLLLPQ